MANDRQITLAGDFKKNVDISLSLTNGDSCSASNYGHAEGFKSSADGKYSYAGGYSAKANDNRSFVWSGRYGGTSYASKGDGTFNIWTDIGENQNSLKNVYIDGNTLFDNIKSNFDENYEYTRLLTRDNVWGKKNTFSGGVNGGIVLNEVVLTGETNSSLHFKTGTTALFEGTAKAKTPIFQSGSETGAGSLDTLATTQYVKNLFASSINSVSSFYVKRTSSLSGVGDVDRPVYVNSSGNTFPVRDNVVFRSSWSAGNNGKFVFMNNGYIVESSLSLGSSLVPIYVEGGTFKKFSGDVGSSMQFTYLWKGSLSKTTATVGSSLRPVFLSSGVVKEIGIGEDGKNFSFGGEYKPIYIKNGYFAECQSFSTGGGTSGITNVSIDTSNGGTYKPNQFVTHLSSSLSGGNVKIYAYQSQPTIDNILDLRTLTNKYTSSLSALNSLSSSLASSVCPKYTSSLSSIKTSVDTLSTTMSTRESLLKVSSTGTGNVIDGYTFNHYATTSSLVFTKNTAALTSIGPATGSGNVLSGITKSGSSIVPSKIQVVETVTGINSAQTNRFVNSVSYSNGTLSFGWGNASSTGSGYPPSDYLYTTSWSFNGSVSGGETNSTSVTVTVPGYTPIAISGCVISNSNKILCLLGFILKGSEVRIGVGNRAEKSANFSGTVYVLYRKD